jgi:hypothetical protein
MEVVTKKLHCDCVTALTSLVITQSQNSNSHEERTGVKSATEGVTLRG